MTETDIKTEKISDTVQIEAIKEEGKKKEDPVFRLGTAGKGTLTVAAFLGGWFFIEKYANNFGGYYPLLFWGAFLIVSVLMLRKTESASLKRPMFILSAITLLAASGRWIFFASYSTKEYFFPLLPLLGIFTLYTMTYDFKRLSLHPYSDTLISAFIGAFANIPNALKTITFRDDKEGTERMVKKDPSERNQVLKGLLWAAPIALLTFFLLIQGDMDFRNFAGSIIRGFRFPEIDLGYLPWAIFFGLYYLGLIHSVAVRKKDTVYLTDRKITMIPVLTSVTIIWVMDVIFFFFIYARLRVFARYGTFQTALSISQFAREGFFSLLLVMVINGVLLTVLKTYTDRKTPALKIGFSITWLFTVILIVLSYLKMTLYDSMYGYTHLRILVKASLIFFAVSMIFILIYLLVENFNPMKYITAAGLITILTLSIVNIDGLIAKKSYQIYKSRGENFDVTFLSELSPDAYDIMANQFNFGSSKDLVVQNLYRLTLENYRIRYQGTEKIIKDPLYPSVSERNVRSIIESVKGY